MIAERIEALRPPTVRRGLSAGWRWSRRLLRPIVPFVVLVALWQTSVATFHLDTFLYPDPSAVASLAWTMTAHGVLPAYIAASLQTWLLAVGGALVIVVPIAFALAFLPTLNRALMPVVRFMTAVAELAWLPLAVLWSGYTLATVLFVVGYTVFFPVLFNTMLGLAQVPQSVIDATRTLGARRWQLLSNVYFPGALPGLVTGVRLGSSYAFRALLVAELYSGENLGVGYMIFSALRDGVTARSIVGMIVLGIVWLSVDRLFLRPIEVATIERWGLSRRPE
jgi:NitT/TauT family transport system permease protein/taurine transport system permease protein